VIAALVLATLMAFDVTAGPVASSSSTAQAAESCKLAILRPTLLNVGERDAYLADLVAEVLAVEIAQASPCEIVTEADIESMLAFEGQKQSLGCDADAPSCLSEIGDALGVESVVTGSVTRAGDRYALSLRQVDVANARVMARAQVFSAQTPEALTAASREGVSALMQRDAAVDDGADDESALAPVLLWGGATVAVLGALVALLGAGSGGGAYVVKEDPNGDGTVRGVASAVWIPLLVVGAVGVVVGVAGATALTGSFAL
jgi:TolB-like protein